MNRWRLFQAVDFGAATLKVAEFECLRNGGLRLTRFGVSPHRRRGEDGWDRPEPITRELLCLQRALGCRAQSAGACVPAFQVWSRHFSMPALPSTKVDNLVRYEAQQQLPFPLTEVVWDYQVLGPRRGGAEVWLVAVKNAVADSLGQALEDAGLQVELLEPPITALANAFRYNYSDLEGGSLLLSLGARSTLVLLFEGAKTFARILALGSDTITQELARATGLKVEEAEQIKLTEGCVCLGAAPEALSSDPSAVLARVAHQVLTRLHGHVQQTIQLYRAQQGGTAPTRLFLAGGGATLPFLPQFLAEKLSLPVEYFNPLRAVALHPALDLPTVAAQAHRLGELVGLALRHVARCPLELSLVPPVLARKQRGAQRLAWAAGLATVALLALLAGGASLGRVAAQYEKAAATAEQQVKSARKLKAEIQAQSALLQASAPAVDRLQARARAGSFWPALWRELQKEVQATEAELRAAGQGHPRVWIEEVLRPSLPSAASSLASGPRPSALVLELQFGLRSALPDADEKLLAQAPFRLLARLQANPFFASGVEPVGGLKPAPDGWSFRFQFKPPADERRGP